MGLPSAAHAVDLSYTNPAGIYTVTASDTGNFAMKTGPNHPNGAGLLLTFTQGGRNLVYSYSSGTYYPFAQLTTNKPTLSNITNGVRASGNLSNASSGGSEQLHVDEDLTVTGTTRENSAIFETLSVRNDGASSVQIGARTAIDFKLANDDGPAFTPDGGSALTVATRYTNPAYSVFYLNDNNGTNPSIPTAPTLRATWSAGPNDFGATPADILEMADYGVKANQPLVPTLPLASTKINADNEVRWIWGPNQSSARTIAPGATVKFVIATSMGALNPVTPTNQHPPVITGSTTQGQVLTASQGDWNDTTGLTAFHYQWQRCNAQGTSCADITGATDLTYTTSVDDLGSTLRVAVTAGSSAAATSDATSVIAGADTTPPAVPTISTAPAAQTSSTNASVAFSGAEPGGSFQCRLDAGTWAACTSPYAASGLSEGAHTLGIRQIDAASNTGDAQSVSWTVDTTAPDAPELTAGPSGQVSNSSASISFDGAEPGGSYQCRLDTGTWATCTSPYTASALSEGGHSVDIRQIDAAGNTGAPQTRSWTVDTVAPSAPTMDDQPAALTTSMSASVSFTTAEPGGSTQCRIDAGLWTTCTSPLSTGALTDGDHSVDVRQIDAAGNTGASHAATWTIDTTPPAAPTITDHPASSTSVATSEIAFSTAESGGSTQCRTDAGPWTTCTSPFATGTLADGDHSVDVRQVDSAGNAGASHTAAWTVDTIAPSPPTVTDAPAALTSAPSASVSFVAAEPGGSTQCRIDDGAWQPCTSPFATGPLSSGDHTVDVRQTDAAGNTGAAQTAAWSIDLQAPQRPTITAGPAAISPLTTAQLAFNESEPGGTFECRIDSGTWAPCTSPLITAPLGDGDHTAQIRQIDGAGNTGDAISRTWTIDTTPPAAPQVASRPPVTTAEAHADIEFSGETDATFEYALDAGVYVPATSPLRLADLTVGTHTLRLRQIDAAGNVGIEKSITWTITPAQPDPAPQTPAPAKSPAAATPPTDGSPAAAAPAAPGPAAHIDASVAGAAVVGGKAAATIAGARPIAITCQTQSLVLSACTVTLYATVPARVGHGQTQTIAIGTATTSGAGSSSVAVNVALNAAGKELLRRKPLGLAVRADIAAKLADGRAASMTADTQLMPAHATLVLDSFAAGSAQLPKTTQYALDQLASGLTAHSAVRIVGHTAAGRRQQRLKDLGRARAQAVRDYLTAHHANAKFTIATRGDIDPKAPNATAAGRDKNRRVVIDITRN